MNDVPAITDPLGKHWDQPSLSEILIDDTHAVMTMATAKKLHEYSTTLPTGKYTGKMWKRRIPWRGEPARWLLCWYGEIQGKEILIHNREILFA